MASSSTILSQPMQPLMETAGGGAAAAAPVAESLSPPQAQASSVETSSTSTEPSPPPSAADNFEGTSSSSTYECQPSTSKGIPEMDDNEGGGRSKKQGSKRNVFGGPKRPRMLFNFTRSELWSSEDEEGDGEYMPKTKKVSSEGVSNGKDARKSYEKDDDYIEEDDQPSSPETSKKSPPKGAKATKSPAKKRSPKKPTKAAPKRKKSPKKESTKKASSATTKKTSNGAAAGPSAAGPSRSSTPYNLNDINALFRTNKVDFEQDLPEEVLIYIFNMLAKSEKNRTQTYIRLSLVCETWRKLIVNTPSLWRKLDLSGFDDKRFPFATFLNSSLATNLFSCIRELNVSGWSSQQAERMIDAICERSNFDLEALNVKCCRNISSSFLQSTIEKCSNIKSLDLSAITSSSFNHCQNPFATSVFRPILEAQGEKLRSLYLSENLIPSFAAFFGVIMETCPNLEVIDVSNITSSGKSASIAIDKFQQSCPNLRVLRAARIDFTCSNRVNTSFSQLEELSIPYNDASLGGFNEHMSVYAGHSDAVIEQLTRGAENLSLLDIRGAGGITPRGLLKIPTWSLKHLWISNCSRMADDSLGLPITKWNNSLEDVDLSWNKSAQAMEASIRAICENVPEDCPLKSVQLRGSAVSYEMLKQLILFCPQLKSIDLQSCRSLPRGIKRAFFDDDFLRLKDEIIAGKYD